MSEAIYDGTIDLFDPNAQDVVYDAAAFAGQSAKTFLQKCLEWLRIPVNRSHLLSNLQMPQCYQCVMLLGNESARVCSPHWDS
jgi:hypothetical protein